MSLDAPRGGRRPLVVVTGCRPDPPWLDTAISWALLERASDGGVAETLRLFRPARVVAFGPADTFATGYEAAREAAAAAGFAPVERLAGGRAAVFHEDTVAVAWTIPDAGARAHIHARFVEVSSLVAEALRRLGADARVGAVPGEYCPGGYSVNLGGRMKVAGLGQRAGTRAAHVGGVVVVDGGERVRDVLAPVYEALGLAWDPATAGSVRDERAEADVDGVLDALIKVAGERYDVRLGTLDRGVVAQARGMRARFEASPMRGAPERDASAVSPSATHGAGGA